VDLTGTMTGQTYRGAPIAEVNVLNSSTSLPSKPDITPSNRSESPNVKVPAASLSMVMP